MMPDKGAGSVNAQDSAQCRQPENTLLQIRDGDSIVVTVR